MSFESLLVQSVTIVHPPTIADRYGNQTPDWPSASKTLAKAWISQRDATEVTVGRDALVSDWIMSLGPDVAVDGGDRVEWEAATFEVVGMPLPAWTPRGLHHYECSLRLTSG